MDKIPFPRLLVNLIIPFAFTNTARLDFYSLPL